MSPNTMKIPEDTAKTISNQLLEVMSNPNGHVQYMHSEFEVDGYQVEITVKEKKNE